MKFNFTFGSDSPNDLRALGWSVAVHNDYKLNGARFTFWLMTKGNMAFKGESSIYNESEALDKIRTQVKNLYLTTAHKPNMFIRPKLKARKMSEVGRKK